MNKKIPMLFFITTAMPSMSFGSEQTLLKRIYNHFVESCCPSDSSTLNVPLLEDCTQRVELPAKSNESSKTNDSIDQLLIVSDVGAPALIKPFSPVHLHEKAAQQEASSPPLYRLKTLPDSRFSSLSLEISKTLSKAGFSPFDRKLLTRSIPLFVDKFGISHKGPTHEQHIAALRCLFDFFDYPTSFLFGSITGHHLAEDYTPSQKECRAGGSEHRRRAVLGVPLKPSNGSTHSESFGEWGYTLYWQNNFRTGEIEDATELYNTFCREKSQKLKAVIQNKARPFIHAGLSFILGGSPSRTLRDHWPSYCKVPDDFFASSLFSSFENEILELDKNFFPPDLLNDDFLLPELVEKLYDVTERASHPEEAGNAREAEEAGNAGETAAPSSSEILALSMPNALEQGYSEQDRATSLPFTPLALTHTLQSEAAQNSLEAIERVFIFLDLDGAAQSPSELTEEILQEAPPAPKSPIIDDHVISAILAAKDHVESERLRRKKTWSFRIKSLLSLFRF